MAACTSPPSRAEPFRAFWLNASQRRLFQTPPRGHPDTRESQCSISFTLPTSKNLEKRITKGRERERPHVIQILSCGFSKCPLNILESSLDMFALLHLFHYRAVSLPAMIEATWTHPNLYDSRQTCGATRCSFMFPIR